MLSAWDRGVLSQAYGVAPGEVGRDAATVAGWRDSADDLLAVLRDRHEWAAARAYRYLRSLRRALLGKQPG